MANTAVVCEAASSDCGCPKDSTTTKNKTDNASEKRSDSPFGCEDVFDGMQVIRKSLVKEFSRNLGTLSYNLGDQGHANSIPLMSTGGRHTALKTDPLRFSHFTRSIRLPSCRILVIDRDRDCHVTMEWN